MAIVPNRTTLTTVGASLWAVVGSSVSVAGLTSVNDGAVRLVGAGRSRRDPRTAVPPCDRLGVAVGPGGHPPGVAAEQQGDARRRRPQSASDVRAAETRHQVTRGRPNGRVLPGCTATDEVPVELRGNRSDNVFPVRAHCPRRSHQDPRASLWTTSVWARIQYLSCRALTEIRSDVGSPFGSEGMDQRKVSAVPFAHQLG